MKSNLYFGVPPEPEMPKIPGFEIVAEPDQWLFAKQGSKLFFIEIRDRSFPIFHFDVTGAFECVTYGLRRAFRLFPLENGALRADKAITIPV